MRKWSSDKDVNEEVKRLLRNGWRDGSGRRHPIVVSPTGIRLPVPSSPSCRFAANHFKRDVIKILKREELKGL